MAVQKLTYTNNAVLEINNCQFRRTGAIEAQLPLGSDFDSANAEAGMILRVVPGDSVMLPESVGDGLLALHYTTEKLYNQYEQGLNNWSCAQDGFLPRLGYLQPGDKFTTNCICYETDTYADDAALKDALASGSLYAIPHTSGRWELVAISAVPADAGIVGIASASDLPNGDYAVQIVITALKGLPTHTHEE